jgi:hypothetical protein
LLHCSNEYCSTAILQSKRAQANTNNLAFGFGGSARRGSYMDGTRMPFSWENNEELTKLTFDPTPIPTDRTWGFCFTLADGSSDVVSGFSNQTEASAWLSSNHCERWLNSRGYVRDRS